MDISGFEIRTYKNYLKGITSQPSGKQNRVINI